MSENEKRGVSRRRFMTMAGAAGAGALLSGMGMPAAEAQMATRVPTRPFGKSGIEVSMLSLGGMFDTGSNALLLQQALRWGVTYWDTADCYSYGSLGSEGGIGRFFSRFPEARNEVFLVTKSDDRDPEGMDRLLARSLKRLGTDRIDLYFIHGVRRVGELTDEMRRWAEKQKNEGRIRLFGFSTHSNMEALLMASARMGWIDGIMFTYNYRLMHEARMKEAVDACHAAGVGLTAMKTQGGGAIRTASETELEMGGRFLEKGFTQEQAKLKAVWENPKIASLCSQMPSMAILSANVAAALDRTTLSAADHRLMRQYAAETRCDYCAGCTELCEPALSIPMPIGDVLRALMYARSYGDRGLARQTFELAAHGLKDQMAVMDFTPAEKRCPRGLAIGRLMREAMEELA